MLGIIKRFKVSGFSFTLEGNMKKGESKGGKGGKGSGGKGSGGKGGKGGGKGY